MLKMREAGILAKALENKPVIDDRLLYIFDAFSEISESRNYLFGGGPAPLSFKDALAYGQFYELSPSEIRWIWSYVKPIDNAWLTKKVQLMEKAKTQVVGPGIMPPT